MMNMTYAMSLGPIMSMKLVCGFFSNVFRMKWSLCTRHTYLAKKLYSPLLPRTGLVARSSGTKLSLFSSTEQTNIVRFYKQSKPIIFFLLTLIGCSNVICKVASDSDVFIPNCRTDHPIPEVSVFRWLGNAGPHLLFDKTRQAIRFLREIHPSLFRNL